jgi:hypothetical protein
MSIIIIMDFLLCFGQKAKGPGDLEIPVDTVTADIHEKRKLMKTRQEILQCTKILPAK